MRWNALAVGITDKKVNFIFDADRPILFR